MDVFWSLAVCDSSPMGRIRSQDLNICCWTLCHSGNRNRYWMMRRTAEQELSLRPRGYQWIIALKRFALPR